MPLVRHGEYADGTDRRTDARPLGLHHSRKKQILEFKIFLKHVFILQEKTKNIE